MFAVFYCPVQNSGLQARIGHGKRGAAISGQGHDDARKVRPIRAALALHERCLVQCHYAPPRGGRIITKQKQAVEGQKYAGKRRNSRQRQVPGAVGDSALHWDYKM
jgi:hypothetical protein